MVILFYLQGAGLGYRLFRHIVQLQIIPPSCSNLIGLNQQVPIPILDEVSPLSLTTTELRLISLSFSSVFPAALNRALIRLDRPCKASSAACSLETCSLQSSPYQSLCSVTEALPKTVALVKFAGASRAQPGPVKPLIKSAVITRKFTFVYAE
jgi:hypothetical protein